MRKIPATIVTGFLGAGKTSLIRRLIEQAGGRRLGFIINEFGDLGIDRGIIEGHVSSAHVRYSSGLRVLGFILPPGRAS